MAQPLLRPAGVLEDEYGLELLTLDILCLKKYGPTYIDWDSDALKAELTEDFGAVGDMTWERIQAGRLLHKNNSFWKEWEVFEKVTASIVGEHPIFSYAQPPEADEIAIAIDTALRVEDYSYDDDVLGYIAAACLADGLWYFEGPLEVAQSALLDHDRRKNIDRDLELVASKLQTIDSYIKSPDTAIEVQVNNVIAVRKAVEAQRNQISKQMKTLPTLLGEA